MKGKYFLLLLLIGVIAGACDPIPADPQSIIDTDLAFSKMSEEQGLSDAFIQYADSSVVLLRNGTDPIVGYSSLVSYYGKVDDSSLKLTWAPEDAEVAISGDLGYSWGKYYLSTPDTLGADTTQMGYYVSIWKKQSDGSWKYVLDGGTEPVRQEN